MKLLVVTETGDAWPSGYVRALIFRNHFKRIGWDVTFAARRSERLTKLIDHPSSSVQRMMRMGGGRLIATFNRAITKWRTQNIGNRASAYDAVFLQKVDSLTLFQSIKARSRARVVFDLNDGLWLPHWRTFLGGQLEHVLEHADAVTCDNPFGLAYAEPRSKKCFLVPDPPQVEAFDACRDAVVRTESPVRIGWVGSRNTASNLFAAFEAIDEVLTRESNCELRLLGTDLNNPALPRFSAANVTCLPRYGQADMIREILAMQIGLFPMFDVEESRARGILKATVYMSGGACLVAHPVGQVSELIQHGRNGMLPSSRQEWSDTLTALIVDSRLRETLRAEALSDVRTSFSIDTCFERLVEALKPDG